MASLGIQLLGVFQVRLGSDVITEFASNKVRALLAYLVMESGRPHARETLAGLLWPEAPEADALASLRNALANLRRAIGDRGTDPPYLLITSETVQFNRASDFHLDTEDLLRIESGRHHPPALCSPADIERKKAAVDGYSGPFLAGLAIPDSIAFEEWSILWREKLARIMREELGCLADHFETCGEYPQALEYAQRQVALEPWLEEGHRQVMRMLAMMGQRSAALAQFEACKRALMDELNVEPVEETQRLYESIRDGGVKTFAGSLAVDETHQQSARPRLPTPLTSFIGRKVELAEIPRLLGYPLADGSPERWPDLSGSQKARAAEKTRLLTLSGAGGCGKTRLAIAAAQRLTQSGSFPHGVWWVDFTPVNNPELVLPTVSTTFGIGQMASSALRMVLLQYLHDRELLLVLDNCEHLVVEVARLVQTMLEESPHLQILATSREPLGVPGEVVWRVPGMAHPDLPNPENPSPICVENLSAFDAVLLFEARAETAVPGLRLEEHPAAVIEICNRLDGIPLAIELAAARLGAMSVDEVRANLGDQFHFLTRGERTTLPRHQTLRACIDWSYALLSPEERALLRCLSTFSGSWTLEAARAVSEPLFGPGSSRMMILDLISNLVDRSLVVVGQAKNLGTRYRLLETIRQYAREKLVEAGEEEALLNAHLAYYVDLSDRAKKELRGPDMARWLDWMMAELPNLRAATECSLTMDPTSGMRICTSLLWFWYSRTIMRIGGAMLERCMNADAARNTPPPKADPAYTQVRGEALNMLVFITEAAIYMSGIGYASAAQRIEAKEKLDRRIKEAEALFRSIGKPGRPGLAFLYRYSSAYITDDPLHQRELLEESLAITREEGNKFELAESLSYLGNHLFQEDRNTTRAKKYIAEELSLREEIGDIDGISWVNYEMGTFALWESDFPQAQRYFEEALRLYRMFHQIAYQHRCQSYLAHLACLQGDHESALRYADIMLAAGNETGIIWMTVTGLQRKSEVLLFADPVQAELLNRQALAHLAKTTTEQYADISLELQVFLEMIKGRHDRAAQLLAALEHLTRNVYPYRQARWDQSRATIRTAIGEVAFDSAYSAGSTMTLAQALALAMDVPYSG